MHNSKNFFSEHTCVTSTQVKKQNIDSPPEAPLSPPYPATTLSSPLPQVTTVCISATIH